MRLTALARKKSNVKNIWSKLVPVRKVHFLSFRPKGEILAASTLVRLGILAFWIPAFAGMTDT